MAIDGVLISSKGSWYGEDRGLTKKAMGICLEKMRFN